jgi:hypothetical protein
MSNETKPGSPLDELLARMENDLRLRRREIDTHLAPIEMALAAYRRALEAHAATEYAASHHLPRPELAALSPRVAAFNLIGTVEALREMPRTAETRDVQERRDAAPALEAAEAERPRSLVDALPKVAAACDDKKLAIVGALAGRQRPLPEPLQAAAEWIDTSDGGAHVLGNLPTRIRQHRVFAVIICDQAISHQHSEPVVAAARAAQVPIGFAGKGGGAALARALKAIEEQL